MDRKQSNPEELPMKNLNSRVLVPFASETEDMEMIILTDILSRAGAQVVRASFEMEPVTLQYGTRLFPDARLKDLREEEFDLIAIPGGWKGAQKLDADPDLTCILERFRKENRTVAAVCSAPNVLRRHGFMKEGTPFTSHPASIGFAEGGVARVEEPVIVTPGLITGRSAGHTLDWALALVEFLFGEEKRKEVHDSLGLIQESLNG